MAQPTMAPVWEGYHLAKESAKKPSKALLERHLAALNGEALQPYRRKKRTASAKRCPNVTARCNEDRATHAADLHCSCEVPRAAEPCH